MKQILLTKETMRRFAEIGSQDGLNGDAIVVVKFFTPDSNWTWLATEMSYYDKKDNLIDVTQALAEENQNWACEVDPHRVIFFGYVIGLEKEWGSFALTDILTTRGPYGMPIERDAHCGERTVDEHCRKVA